MGLNDTPSAERVHIGFFGNRNAGKSSLVNAIAGQNLAVVSEVPGTTTDPVRKTMELLPIGPVVIIDTPGYDDVGMLGKKRVDATKRTLNMTDIAVLVVDCKEGMNDNDRELIDIFEEKDIPYIIVYNKADLLVDKVIPQASAKKIYVSAITGENIHELKEMIAHLKKDEKDIRFVADFINEGDFVVMVVPIDTAAPKGRIILPQQQALRDILDANARAIVVKEDKLKDTLDNIGIKPALVITDSQVFEKVNKDTPDDIPLTSFSILMARYKGFLDMAVNGAKKLSDLRDGDKILICEGCTHHRQCEDIGTVKLPNWIKKYSGKDVRFEFTSGHGFPEKLSGYDLMIHCGGCMLNEREIRFRMQCAKDQGVPVTNYGTAIAYLKGILDRSISIIYKNK